MNDEIIDLGFRVNTMGLLNEIADCSLPRSAGVLFIPLNVFKNLLAEVAQRAIEIDDPKLNVLMLRLNLYEVSPDDIVSKIKEQLKLISDER